MKSEPTAERLRWRVLVTLTLAVVAAVRLYLGRGIAYTVVLVSCMLATALLVPWVARIARRYDIVSLPGGRDIHQHPTPRAGGVAVFVPIALILILWSTGGDLRIVGLLVGGTLVFACGMLDDVRPVSPGLKILVQLLAGTVLLAAGFRLPTLGIPGVGELALGDFEYPAILLWVVLVTNAVNLSDGLDGLATSLTVLGLAVFVMAGVPSALPVALAGACLGFFYHNYPRARIFLGDSGSLLLGFLLAGLALELPSAANVPLAVAALAYPLGDVVLVALRRWMRGKPVMAPDRSHVHHRALLYLEQPLLALAAVMAFSGLHALVGVKFPGKVSLATSFALWLLLAIVLVRLGQSHPGRAPQAGRRRMRRLHALQTYISESIAASRDSEDLVMALQHFVEGSRLCGVTVDGLGAVHRRGCVCAEQGGGDGALSGAVCETHPVTSRHGGCTWRGACSTGDVYLDQERETVVTAVLRLAAERRGALAPPDEKPEAPDDAI